MFNCRMSKMSLPFKFAVLMVFPLLSLGMFESAHAKNIKTTASKTRSVSARTFSVEEMLIQFTETASALNKKGNDGQFADAKFEVVPQLETDSHTRLVPRYENGSLVFVLQVDSVALNNPRLLVKDLGTIAVVFTMRCMAEEAEKNTLGFRNDQMVVIDTIRSLHSVAELITNANTGSPTARYRWNEIQIFILNNVSIHEDFTKKYSLQNQDIRDALVMLQNRTEPLKTDALTYVKEKERILNNWRRDTKALDILEAQELKLNDLLVRNDRAGVANLLEMYLPWPLMEPVEINAWKIWLEAIRNPDLKNTRIAFRGVDYQTDKVQRGRDSRGETLGFMSTVLTKNQGSYTRRLRSLTTNRERNGDPHLATGEIQGSSIVSVKMMDQWQGHSYNPGASNFLSFSYNPYVANTFATIEAAKGGMLVVKMDSRRLMPNINSVFPSELELLVPLLVFPDEVLEYHEGKFSNDELKLFLNDLSKKENYVFENCQETTQSCPQAKGIFDQQGIDFAAKMFDLNQW